MLKVPFQTLRLQRSLRLFSTAGGSAAADQKHKLPPQAIRLEVPGYVEDKEKLNLTLLPILHGRLIGPGSGEEAANAIRATAPREVFVELCRKRYGEVLSSAVLGLPLRPPSRFDILGNIHGGLLQHELAPVLRAAREVGAAVIPVDRPRSATMSRVAQRLWHPKLIQGLLRFGGYSLGKQREGHFALDPSEGEELRRELERNCPAAHEVLVEERSDYLVHQVTNSSVSGEAALVCGAPLCAHLLQALKRGPSADGPEEANRRLLRIAKRGVPVWPLYAFAYMILPSGIAIWVGLSAWESFIVPALFEDEDRLVDAAPGHGAPLDSMSRARPI
eukprot:TRINITY_DN8355_c0_g3_i1.p1 TRINITY_DN8355_c0_g3~~TRINITY_DN8355_c0_g3_i1.p1  ORF type:complete len:333 (+),score=41.14 TRINITY_DN8355_c0_g3_i1:54-1052(+)